MPKFCTACGAALDPGARFCGQCGGAVQPGQATPGRSPAGPPMGPAVAPAATEPILGIVPALQRRKGFLGMSADTFNLVITPQRLVFAFVSPQTMRQAVTEARDEARSQGRGFFGQVAAQMGWVDVVCHQYSTMPVEAIPAHFPGSFVVPNIEVRRIRLKESIDDESGSSSGELIVETTGGKHAFNLVGMEVDDARQLLRQALPAVVR